MTRSLNLTQERKRIVVVVGEEGCGKTCLTKHLVKGDVSSCLAEHKKTVDESHYTIQKMADGKCEQIQFIDTSPWQEFPVMHRLYVRTCELVVIAYDVTSKTWKESLTNMIKEIKEIKDSVDIMIVGTHSDETNMVMSVTPAHVREVIGCLPHVYISSVTGFGIPQLWHKLLTTDTALTDGHIIRDKIESPKLRRRTTMQRLARKTSSLLCTSTKFQTL